MISRWKQYWIPCFTNDASCGLGATAKTPHAVIERLNSVVNRALPELKERYAAIGTDIAGGSVSEFTAYIKTEFDKWAKVVKISGAKAE